MGHAAGHETFEESGLGVFAFLGLVDRGGVLVELTHLHPRHKLKILLHNLRKLEERHHVRQRILRLKNPLKLCNLSLPALAIHQQEHFQHIVNPYEDLLPLSDCALVDVPAYIVLYAPTKTRCDTGQETFLGGVVSDELGRVAAVDEVLELAAVEELVPAEEVEKDLVLLVAAHQELPEHLHLGQVHDTVLQQVLEEVHMPHLHLRLRWLPRHQVQRFVRLAHLVMFDVAADEVGKGIE